MNNIKNMVTMWLRKCQQLLLASFDLPPLVILHMLSSCSCLICLKNCNHQWQARHVQCPNISPNTIPKLTLFHSRCNDFTSVYTSMNRNEKTSIYMAYFWHTFTLSQHVYSKPCTCPTLVKTCSNFYFFYFCSHDIHQVSWGKKKH
jgi:hypothetical protein